MNFFSVIVKICENSFCWWRSVGDIEAAMPTVVVKTSRRDGPPRLALL
jgi:hypothetical protein